MRKRYIVKGYVQQVGYRVLVKMIANRLGIVGFAHNLPDRSVEVVCEGEPEAIERFIGQIARKGDPASTLDIDVASIEEAPPAPDGKLTTFEIDYGRKLTVMEKEATDRDERMILGASDLTKMVGGVGKAVEVVGQKVDGVGKAVEGVGQKVDTLGMKMDCVGQKVDGVGKDVRDMHSDMNKRFDHMAQRYDFIATSLVKAIDRMDQGFERMDKNSKRTDKAIELSRKEVAASNRELAKAVNFMIRKMSDKPVPRKSRKKRAR